MRRDRVSLIAGKELLDTVRDRRTLFVALVLPLLLYPSLLLVMTQLVGATQRDLRREHQRVLVRGLGREHELYRRLGETVDPVEFDAEVEGLRRGVDQLLAGIGVDELLDRLEAKLDRPPERPEPAERLSEGKQVLLGEVRGLLERYGYSAALFYDARASGGGRPRRERAAVLFDPTDERSRAAGEKTQRALADYGRHWRRRVIDGHPEQVTLMRFVHRPVLVRPVELASPSRKGAHSFAPMLGMLLVIMALTGAFYPAVDLVAGEKERATMETILVAPVSRAEILVGKFLAVWLVAVVTALLNLLVMGLTFSKIATMVGGGAGIAFGLAPSAILVVTAGLVPTAALFSALALALSSFATSYKEGQHYLTPLFIAAILPSMMALLPNTELGYGVALVPVANVVLLVKSMLLGGEAPGPALVAVAAMVVYAAAALAAAVAVFRREGVLFRVGGGRSFDAVSLRTARRGLPTPGQAVLLFFTVVALMFYLAARPPGSLGGAVRAFLLAQGVAILLPALVFARRLKLDVRESFGLRGFRPAWLPALLGAAAGTVILVLGMQRFVIGERAPQGFERLVEMLREGPVWVGIVLLAVLPPVCEELLCRGFLVAAFRARFGNGRAVWITALLFAALHLDLHRFPATFAAGLLLGFVRVRSGSVFACMVVHAVYNGVIALALYLPVLEEGLAALGAPELVLAGAGLGAALLFMRGRPPQSGLRDAPAGIDKE
ncbi:MAG: ABC transporter permease subunit/CPBP intramembrane protease [Planctomycetota bacterium]